MAIDVTLSRVLGTTLGVVSAISSGVNFPCSPTIANGVKLAIDVALLPAGPIADVIGGIAEGTGYENSLANSIQNIADDYLIPNP